MGIILYEFFDDEIVYADRGIAARFSGYPVEPGAGGAAVLRTVLTGLDPLEFPPLLTYQGYFVEPLGSPVLFPHTEPTGLEPEPAPVPVPQPRGATVATEVAIVSARTQPTGLTPQPDPPRVPRLRR